MNGNIVMTDGLRVKWIDCAKTIAIMAVAIDHCNGILYTNPLLAWASYFSVSLFILLSGVSTWLSDMRTNKTFVIQLKRAGRLYLQYALATLILYVFYMRFFDLKTYITYLMNFSITGPFYFFVFFIQLVILTPVLLGWCKYCNGRRYRWLWHLATLLFLGWFSSVCIRYTYILPVHGGGQYLFGGTYLLLYYLGMLLESVNVFLRNRKEKIIIFIFSLSAWIFWWLMCFYGKLPFDKWMESYWGGGFNPPSVQFMIFSIITLFLFYSFFSLLEESNITILKALVKLFSTIGKYTLYTFMYHIMLRDFFMAHFPGLLERNVFMRIFVFIMIVVLPVIVITLVKRIITIIKMEEKGYEKITGSSCKV